jgi:hypothetical protein
VDPVECADVVFIGLRGSGEVGDAARDYGAAVKAVRDALADAVEAGGATMSEVAVDYPADGPIGSDWTWVSDLASGDAPFVHGARTGGDLFARIARDALARCGDDSQVVAVGFSQGAMALRLGLGLLDPGEREGLASVDVISDPLREAGSPTANRTALPEQGIARFTPDDLADPDVAGVPDLAPGWRSWCVEGDPVCAAGTPDTSAAAVLAGLAGRWSIHATSYQSAGAATPVVDAIAADLALPGPPAP